MENDLKILFTHIKNDYYQWTLRGRKPEDLSEVNKKMIAEFNESIQATTGKKYIKIIRENSVWGFIVNTDDDKTFKKGDILKAAGYNTPARNKSRGNIIAGDYSWVRWTGPEYLK